MSKTSLHYSRERVMKRYGLTISDYHQIFESQKGKCPICKDTFKMLVIDHDHKLIKFRGLICRRCNVLLGMAKDNKEILIGALLYMLRWIEQEKIPDVLDKIENS